jgi:excisionase family DNA binding protein
VLSDSFIDAVKLQFVEAIKAAFQMRSDERSRREALNQPPILGPRAFSIREVSKLLGVSIATITRRIREGKLHSVKLGGRVLVPLKSLQNLLDESE